MIDAIRQRFHVSKKHGASASATELVPAAMNVQVLFRRFFAFGDRRSDFRPKNFRAAARERVEARVAQFTQRVADRFLGKPGEMQNLNGGEALQLKTRIELLERAQHTGVVAKWK